MSHDMRVDSDKSNTYSNGARSHANGPSSSAGTKGLQVDSASGHMYADGGSNTQANGSGSVPSRLRAPTYYGHDREEVARLLIQCLNDLGYNESANKLIQESGYELEVAAVAAFRHAVLEGEWSEVEMLLFGSTQSFGHNHSPETRGLILAQGVDTNDLRFRLRRQKYLELLERRDHGSALMVLRQELTPLHQDVDQLHILSGFMVCPSAEDLKVQAAWDGAQGSSRHVLLAELSKSVAPSVMIPDHRLAVLLDQVKQNWVSKCYWHNPTEPASLFSDHACHRSQFPLQIVRELTQNGEVWFLEFSHDGSRLAASGQDNAVIVYDTIMFQERLRLNEHKGHVAYVSWSPKDDMLITCSQDKTAKLWDTTTGECLSTITAHNEPVTSAAWTPDNASFIVGSLDKQASIQMWRPQELRQGRTKPSYSWPPTHRVQDLAISPDGQRLVTISDERQIFVYNLVTRHEDYSIRFKTQITCVNISRNSRHMLLNMADNELQLIEIDTMDVVQRFMGQKQGRYVIRSSFGGADENLIISGSEDGKIYVFHRETGTCVQVLDGHAGGCVNAVAWNPNDPCMFASAGDDKRVRIWSKETHTPATTRRTSSESSPSIYNNRLAPGPSATLV